MQNTYIKKNSVFLEDTDKKASKEYINKNQKNYQKDNFY